MKGAYCLVISLPEATTLRTRGREFRLAPGTYAYCGSAMGSLDARVGRHLRSYRQGGVRRFWHIDHLLPRASGLRAVWAASHSRAECKLVSALAGRGLRPIPGFGNSDCRSGCPGHLLLSSGSVASTARLVESAFSQLGLNSEVLEPEGC